MLIPFTQYIRPHGHRRAESIDRSDDIGEKARHCIEQGGRFTAEVLTTGQVSLAFELDGDDLDIEVTDNGPDVPHAVDRLVERVHAALTTKAA